MLSVRRREVLRLRREQGLTGKLPLGLEISYCGRQELTFYTMDVAKMARGPALSHATEDALRYVIEDSSCRVLVLRVTLFPWCLREPWGNWAAKIFRDIMAGRCREALEHALRWGCGCGEASSFVFSQHTRCTTFQADKQCVLQEISQHHLDKLFSCTDPACGVLL